MSAGQAVGQQQSSTKQHKLRREGDGLKPLHAPDDQSPRQPLEVRYADAALLVLNKPAGLLSVPGRGADKQDCLASRVQALYPDALVVHRLDMATSGLLLMARGPAMQRALSQAFAAQQVAKRYVAVVAGELVPAPGQAARAPDWQVVNLPIAADWANRPLRKIDPANGKPSVTRWRVLGVQRWRVLSAADPRVPHEHAAISTTRIELEPLTGRTHQLRLHMQALGQPILGDTLYAPAAVQALSPRLLLHASSLALAHPVSGHWLEFSLPAAF